MPEQQLQAHTLDACKAAARSYVLIKHGLRPFPQGHSLPAFLMPLANVQVSRAAWEGEPREEKVLLLEPEIQFWMPRWVDIVTELWVGSNYLEGEKRIAQRDAVLQVVLQDKPLQGKIVDAYREDLRAVRELLRPHIIGPLPVLLSEHEAKLRPSS